MIRSKLLLQNGTIKEVGKERIAEWRQEPGSKIWLDIQFSDLAEPRDILDNFGCHPLAIQDALRTRHPPKIEGFEQHLFILYRGILSVTDEIQFEHQQVAFFVSDRFIISLHPGTSKGVDHVWQIDLMHPLEKSPFDVALRIMHYSAGLYLEAILNFESNLSDLEDELQTHGDDNMLSQISSYRSRLLKLKRVFNYLQTITSTLLSNQNKLEGASITEDRYYHLVNDLHERFERLHSLTQMHYEICGDLIESYLSIASHQLNVTMRILTVITAVFVPLSFMAGLYGMNFDYIPELKVHNGYFYLLGCMVLCASGLIFYFKRRRWF